MAVSDLAKALGYRRVGPRIREVLLTDLLTVVRRGTLQNERRLLSLDCRTIEEFPRDFLKTQFLAAIGAEWIAREEASMRFSRAGSGSLALVP